MEPDGERPQDPPVPALRQLRSSFIIFIPLLSRKQRTSSRGGTRQLGITAEGLDDGAYRIVSGDDWLALVGNDENFVPKEPWARGNSQIRSGELQAAWNKITGEEWGVPGAGMYKNRLVLPIDYGLPGSTSKATDQPRGGTPRLELWSFDERGSFNAVCGYLRSLGVRWYLPGELGEVVPRLSTLPLPQIDETVRPDFALRQFNVRFSVVAPEYTSAPDSPSAANR